MSGRSGRSAPTPFPPALVRDSDLSGLSDGPLAGDLLGYLAVGSIDHPCLAARRRRAFDHWLAVAAASGAAVISVLMISTPIAH